MICRSCKYYKYNGQAKTIEDFWVEFQKGKILAACTKQQSLYPMLEDEECPLKIEKENKNDND